MHGGDGVIKSRAVFVERVTVSSLYGHGGLSEIGVMMPGLLARGFFVGFGGNFRGGCGTGGSASRVSPRGGTARASRSLVTSVCVRIEIGICLHMRVCIESGRVRRCERVGKGDGVMDNVTIKKGRPFSKAICVCVMVKTVLASCRHGGMRVQVYVKIAQVAAERSVDIE